MTMMNHNFYYLTFSPNTTEKMSNNIEAWENMLNDENLTEEQRALVKQYVDSVNANTQANKEKITNVYDSIHAVLELYLKPELDPYVKELLRVAILNVLGKLGWPS